MSLKTWRMSTNYSIGQNRTVSVSESEFDTCLTISEAGQELKSITLSSRRWAQFMEVMSQVDEAVHSLLAKQYVQLNIHIGGKCYLSVTTGFACQYYFNKTKGPSPTKTGIALRLSEWTALKELIPQLHQQYPVLSTTQPCTYQLDHQNLEGALSCMECHPFLYDELLHSLGQ